MSKPIETNDLKAVFKNSFALYLKTLNHHWHVRGPTFFSLHNLFETQYMVLLKQIDSIAERIVQLNDRVPATMETILHNLEIKETNSLIHAEDMIKDLIEAHQIIIPLCQKTIAKAEQNNDETTIGIISDQLAFHEKQIWMLKSSLPA